MSDREARTVRVDPDVWATFIDQIDEWDGENPGHVGYHVEQALSEYVDRDRYARVEDKLDRVLAHVSDGGGTHTHTSTGASETVERAREIYQRVADNHGLVLRDDDLVRAIEDIAGADDRTVAKYQEILKRRSLIFEHPADSPVWTTDREKWVRWVVNHVDNDPTLKVHDMIDDYELTTERFDELAEAHE
jgi:predicted transcriptional regulator